MKMNEERTYIKKIDGKWYAFAGNAEEGQVYSIGSDCPKYGCALFGRWTDEGIKYVASSSPSRGAAYQKARRYGTYRGEV